MSNNSKNIVLGICAGIAAYRMYDLINELKKLNHNVTVVLTHDAKNFVNELTLKVLSSNNVYSDMFDPKAQSKPMHIELADKADIVLVAPATADFVAKNRRSSHYCSKVSLVTNHQPPALSINML